MAPITITVLELDISCQKCKTKVLQAVTSIQGVDKVVTDEAKGTVEVTGTADSCYVIERIRKALSCARKTANVVRIGPPPKPDQTKKPEDKKPDRAPCSCPLPCPCPYPPYSCPYGYVVMAPENNASCSIL